MESIEVNGAVYQIKKLLGKGKGGYSYLVTDGSRELVCKQIHHEPCSYYQFGNKLESELRDYERLSAVGIPMPRLLDVDESRERILKEYIPGDTVYDMVLRGELDSNYIEQARAMCQTLYPAGLNIDYFPTNFIPFEGTLYYVDYECNGYIEQWDFEHWGIAYWSQTETFLNYAREHGDI